MGLCYPEEGKETKQFAYKMKEIHKKWIIALQTSRKTTGTLYKIVREKGCCCCLGVLAEAANIKKEANDSKKNFLYTFKKATSTGTFEDWYEFGLFGNTGGFSGLNIVIKNMVIPIQSLTFLNDSTSLTHKEIAKFIYIFKDKILRSETPIFHEKFVFKNDKELKEYIKEKAAKSNFATDLKKWEEEFKLVANS